MSKIIIGIHGLGKKPAEPILEKWWKRSIQEGLSALGHPRLWFRFKLVYWADLLHEPCDPKITDPRHPRFLKEPYTPGNPNEVRTPSRVRQRFLDYLERQLDKLFLKKNLSIHFVAVTDFIMRSFFKDLDAYYSSTTITINGQEQLLREVIRQRLAQVLRRHRKQRIMLIGHSMGSIIAYDVLSQTAPDVAIDTLVTVGSPLGMPIIIAKVASEMKGRLVRRAKLQTPENVMRFWYNFSDLRDRVTLNYNLGDDYRPNSRGVHVVDKIVFNNYVYKGRKNPHKIYGYLRAPQFAQVVHEFLNYGRSQYMIWLSDQLNFALTKIIGFFKRNR
ncbi:MAG: GPI inositol-deacylase [candidate division KSB1 bacterium]|nr:GPI inositol-deacylase [candidate division KSB1 bacterium]MDZ7333788.1 GPI inositol-deacylase [candidate division KSB1 bacterium]MDZ7357539.1 GPI inositol-deacylase [candidate division KSB1 bacterium]MDZ7375452.1 GPI inositol-deacylase [candidate division KSB1 bacterium]MDZ7400548.1 GPI inositol-deacylase [candidate division KSB1 bacterium]